jgi:hypothetical protein
MKTNDQVMIGKQAYIVVRTREFEHDGAKRVPLTLRKPNGKRMYNVVLYETGKFSSVVPIV